MLPLFYFIVSTNYLRLIAPISPIMPLERATRLPGSGTGAVPSMLEP